jgi:hypothetical protein
MKISDTDRAKLEDLFNLQEIKVIDQLSDKKELSEIAVLRQALRLYQLVETGLEENRFSHNELDELINPLASLSKKFSPYGICPKCGGNAISRERRPDGNDKCENGHVYPSKDTIKKN